MRTMAQLWFRRRIHGEDSDLEIDLAALTCQPDTFPSGQGGPVMTPVGGMKHSPRIRSIVMNNHNFPNAIQLFSYNLFFLED